MYDEMQTKLREGLKILEEASEQDRDRLGLALMKVHGALADCLRLELSQKAPHLGLEAQDTSRTSWQDLIRYGQEYLELSESDARLISAADRQQQHIAGGGTYTESRAELVEYAEFVGRRCRDRIQPVEAATAAASPIPGLPALPEAPGTSRRWYRSPWLLTAYSVVLVIFFCTIGFLSYSATFLDYMRKTFERPTPTPQWTPTAAPETLPSPTFALANTEAGCIIVWVEHPTDDLGRKTRARVYEEFVSDRVKAAGLAPRDFYDQVVEHNPVLEADDYEFKTGKKYLLPQCQ